MSTLFSRFWLHKNEKTCNFMITAGLMHSENMKFKMKSREEQAKPEGHENADFAGYILYAATDVVAGSYSSAAVSSSVDAVERRNSSKQSSSNSLTSRSK